MSEITNACWYAVYVQSGTEAKFKESLENAVAKRGLGDYFDSVLLVRSGGSAVPHDEKNPAKSANKNEEKVFRSYTFVKMVAIPEMLELVTSLKPRPRFLGDGGKPIAVPEEQVMAFVETVSDVAEKEEETMFDDGGEVMVISGPFQGFVAKVAEVNHDKKRLKVMVNILGRDNMVDLDFSEVKQV